LAARAKAKAFFRAGFSVVDFKEVISEVKGFKWSRTGGAFG